MTSEFASARQSRSEPVAGRRNSVSVLKYDPIDIELLNGVTKSSSATPFQAHHWQS